MLQSSVVARRRKIKWEKFTKKRARTGLKYDPLAGDSLPRWARGELVRLLWFGYILIPTDPKYSRVVTTCDSALEYVLNT